METFESITIAFIGRIALSFIIHGLLSFLFGAVVKTGLEIPGIIKFPLTIVSLGCVYYSLSETIVFAFAWIVTIAGPLVIFLECVQFVRLQLLVTRYIRCHSESNYDAIQMLIICGSACVYLFSVLLPTYIFPEAYDAAWFVFSLSALLITVVIVAGEQSTFGTATLLDLSLMSLLWSYIAVLNFAEVSTICRLLLSGIVFVTFPFSYRVSGRDAPEVSWHEVYLFHVLSMSAAVLHCTYTAFSLAGAVEDDAWKGWSATITEVLFSGFVFWVELIRSEENTF
eukprot:Rmarinus@m.6261